MSFEPGELEIRRLAEGDLDSVINLASVLEEAPHWPRQLYEEALRTDSVRPRIALVVCDRGRGEVVGFALASLVPPEAELETIAVAARFQRRGVGRQLLAVLVRELQQVRVQELLLEVRASNHPAIRFYRAQNFKQTGIRTRYYIDPQEDAVLMSLQLI